MNTIYIIAFQAAKELGDDNDVEINGVYAVDIEGEHSSERLASIALDAFHITFPIGCFDDFMFLATDGNNILDENENHEPYADAGLGRNVRKITSETPNLTPGAADVVAWALASHKQTITPSQEKGWWQWENRYIDTLIADFFARNKEIL